MIIKKASFNQLQEIFEIFQQCKQALNNENVFQWTDNYPTLDIIFQDIANSHLYGLYQQDECIGAIVLNSIQSPQYNAILWKDTNGKVLTIHRLAIKPIYQNRGYAKKLMSFAEKYALRNQFTSIRLDTYSANKASVKLYEQRGYEKRGEVSFPERDLPFICFEKNFN